MEIVVRRGSLRNAPNPEYPDKTIVVDVTYADPQARYTCGQAAPTMMDQLPLPAWCANTKTTLDRDMCPSTSAAIN